MEAPIEGNYYWVRPFKGDDFEPAKCKDRYGKGKLYFCFTNGSIIEAERAFEVKPLTADDGSAKADNLSESLKSLAATAYRVCLLTSGQALIFDRKENQIGELQAEFANGKCRRELVTEIARHAELFAIGEWRGWYQEIDKKGFIQLLHLYDYKE